MLKNIIAPVIMLTFASPVLAASGPFFSLRNTDFVVSISFILLNGFFAASEVRSASINFGMFELLFSLNCFLVIFVPILAERVPPLNTLNLFLFLLLNLIGYQCL